MQSQAQPQLLTMIKGQMFEGILLVRAAEQRTASNGSKYLDLTLSDLSGEVNAKMWDGATAAPRAGSVIRLRGMMQDYNNRPQLRVDKLRPLDADESADLSLLIPCAPENPEAMRAEIEARVEEIADPQLREIVKYRLNEAGERLLFCPAAQKLHHAERGGLLHHSVTMLRAAAAICAVYPQLDKDLLAAGVVLHDLCKISEMKINEAGLCTEYSEEGLLLGHLVQGVAELMRAGEKLGTRKELLLVLEHMVLSHHDLPEYGSPRRPMFPEAEVLHTLDQLDARMFEMEYALRPLQPGAFTERIWSLDRRLYKRRDKA